MQKKRLLTLNCFFTRKLLFSSLVILAFLGQILFAPAQAAAAASCDKYGIMSSYDSGPYVSGEISSLEVTVDLSQQSGGADYFIYAQKWGSKVGISKSLPNSTPGQLTFTILPYQNRAVFTGYGRRDMYLWKNGSELCEIGSFKVEQSSIYCGADATKQAWQVRTISGTPTSCYLSPSSCVDSKNEYHFKFTGIEKDGQPYTGEIQAGFGGSALTFNASNGVVEGTIPAGPVYGGSAIELNAAGSCNTIYIQGRVDQCDDLTCNTTTIAQTEANEVNFDLCSQASEVVPTSSGNSEKSQRQECIDCFADGEAIWTAVGCISTEPEGIVEAVVKIGVGIGGGIALLTTLVGGFLITTSQGDPKRIQQGKEMITASAIGILFVLFSVVILQFIGVTIFRLPGFGTS